jgi:hypothetical protein
MGKSGKCDIILIVSNLFWIVVVVCLCVFLYKKTNEPKIINKFIPNIEKYQSEKNIVVSDIPIIPKIIHFVFIDKQNHDNDNITLPPLYEECKNSVMAMNPEYTFKIWNGSMCKELISKRYPWFLQYYESFPSFIFKVDAIRLFILHFEGGIYMDLDIKCIKPIPTEFLHRNILLLTNNGSPDTGIIGGINNHIFFTICIQTALFEYINEAVLAKGYDKIFVDRTQDCCGALLVTKVCSKIYGVIPLNSLKVSDYFRKYAFEEIDFTDDPVFINNFSQSWNTNTKGDHLTNYRNTHNESNRILENGYYCNMYIFNN